MRSGWGAKGCQKGNFGSRNSKAPEEENFGGEASVGGGEGVIGTPGKA